MAITPLPALDRTSVNFKADVDTFFGSQLPTFSTETEAARADIVTRQGQAAASAAAALASEGNALTSKNAAATSAGASDTARIAAQSAQAAAELALDSFDDRYLGAKAVAPALDNDGNALITGAMYWDTVIAGGCLRVWQSGAWVTIPGAVTGSAAQDFIAKYLTVASINGGQLAGMRNRIINGACLVAQRGNVAAVKDVWTYGGSDRIAVVLAGTTASGTIQQYNSQPTSSGCAQGVAGTTTTGVGGIYFQARNEASNVIDLNSKTVTVSCTVFQNTGATQNAQASFVKPTTTINTFAALTTLGTGALVAVPSGVATKITYTMALGAADASLGLAAQIGFPSVGAVTSKDFWVGDLQLELGPVATPFEQRPIGMELALCQRYYEVFEVELIGYMSAGASFGLRVPFKATKRAVPTMTQLSSGVSSFSNINVTASTSGYGSSVTGVTVYRAATAAGATQFSETSSASSEL